MSRIEPTFNYILNDLALSNLIFRTIDNNEVSSEKDKIDIKYQIELLQQENQQLKEKIKQYEDPEDLTLIFMYCSEKAKDKIKELQQQLKQRDEVIDETIKFVKSLSSKGRDCMIYADVKKDILEILQKYKGDNK